MTDLSMAFGNDGMRPRIHPGAWLAPGSVIAGSVHLDDAVNVWYTAVLRSESELIDVGYGSNIQDGAVVHADPGYACTIGRNVTVGHRAVLHGCTVEDGVLVGMGAVVLNGVHIGRGSLIAAGTVVVPGTVVPAGSLVSGVPGRVRRSIQPREIEEQVENARTYVEKSALHASFKYIIR